MSWRLSGRELTSQGAQGDLDLVSRLNCAVWAKITACYPALHGEYLRTRVACKSNCYIISLSMEIFLIWTKGSSCGCCPVWQMVAFWLWWGITKLVFSAEPIKLCMRGQNYIKTKAEGDVGDVLFEFYAKAGGVRCVWSFATRWYCKQNQALPSGTKTCLRWAHLCMLCLGHF